MSNKEMLCVLSKNIISQVEKKLLDLKNSIENATQTLNIEQQSNEFFEQASCSTMIDIEMKRTSDNQKVLKEIRIALNKIKQGTYGICEESGELIEENRLLANPLARYSLEEQQAMEKNKNR